MRITLPVAFLDMLITEDERLGPRTHKDPTLHWYAQSYDEGYVLRGRKATDEEVAASEALDAALQAYALKEARDPS